MSQQNLNLLLRSAKLTRTANNTRTITKSPFPRGCPAVVSTSRRTPPGPVCRWGYHRSAHLHRFPPRSIDLTSTDKRLCKFLKIRKGDAEVSGDAEISIVACFSRLALRILASSLSKGPPGLGDRGALYCHCNSHSQHNSSVCCLLVLNSVTSTPD
jgi:hypothetical protein